MNENCNILLLPDEIKITIFNLVNGIDKANLKKVCKDFQRIVDDRFILRSLIFKKDARVTYSSIKSYFNKAICSHVTHLNMNGVYWIPPAEMRKVLLHFKNVVSLSIVHTQVSFTDLCYMVNQFEQIKKLAFSLRPDSCGDAHFYTLDNKITHLFVTYSPNSIEKLKIVLQNFQELQELCIHEPRIPSVEMNKTAQTFREPKEMILPKVTERLIISRYSTSKYININYKESENLTTIINEDDPILVHLENLNVDSRNPLVTCETEFERNLNALKNIGFTDLFIADDLREMIVNRRSHSDSFFKSINLMMKSRCFSDELLKSCIQLAEAIVTSKNMKFLNTVRLDTIFFLGRKEKQEDNQLFKRQRLCFSVKSNNLLKLLSEHCKDVSEFELVNDADNKYENHWMWQPECLSHISNWKVLRTLILTSVRFQNGAFFIKITQNCKNLERLKIKDDTYEDKISSSLCNALQFAEKLKDFRYERLHTIPIDYLLVSLAHCKLLERLYIQCDIVNKISKIPLENLINNCQDLNFIFIYIISLPETVCKNIRQNVFKQHLKPERFYKISGTTYSLDSIEYQDISKYHVEEMIMQFKNVRCKLNYLL